MNEKKNYPLRFFRSLILCVLIQCFLFSVTAPTSLHAAPTYVGGIVTGLWKAQDSPFFVTNNITVSGLTIESGVEVVFLGNYVFEVPGSMNAVGTESREIIFKATNTIAGWQGMLFQNAVPGTRLEWCRIEGALNSGARIIDSQPSFRFCTFANNSSPSGGGGISVDMSTADLAVSCCIITNNYAGRAHGGGVNAIMGAGTLILSNCIVANNASAISDGNVVGGGIRLQGNGSFVKCVVSDNVCEGNDGIPGGSSSGRGGGIYAAYGTNRFVACTIKNNLARGTAQGGLSGNAGFASGAGLHLANSAVDLVNSIVAENVTSSTHGSLGGGIYADGVALRVRNSTIVNNNILGVQLANGAAATIENSILYFNNGNGTQLSSGAAVTYSDVQGGYSGTGNINFNPILDPEYRIVAGSPCIDAGNPASSSSDICFGPSYPGARNDIGAHGGPDACAWNANCPCDTPTITSQPNGVVACEGENATFHVVASSSGALGYQWFYNTNTPIAGGTNDTLILTNVTINSAGTYHVVVSTRCNSVFSVAATLVVTRLCVSIDLYPGLSIGNLTLGQAYSVQYATNLTTPVSWVTATNFVADAISTFWLDREPARMPRRFYRVIEGP